MLRIHAGEFRSRILDAPEGTNRTRPMASRVKESIFDLLRGWFDGARVLDLFAGVGTMGLEAVSRGAKEVVLLERDRDVYHFLQSNIVKLKCADRAIAIQGDALGPLALERAPKPVDIIFIDPPYEVMLDAPRRRHVLGQIKKLRAVMAGKGFVMLRSPIELPPDEASIEGFIGPEVHEYGREMKVMLFMPGQPPPTHPQSQPQPQPHPHPDPHSQG